MDVRIVLGDQNSALAYGAARLKVALASAGHVVGEPAPATIALEVAPATGGPEDYRIVRDGPARVVVRGGGPSGVMYGALALADDVRAGVALDKLAERDEQARFPFRAIKFNLPWMSYRKGESLQLHQETVRDLSFWTAFLDMMADNRFNVLSLWGLHPFTLMVRPTNFPEACGLSDAELADWRRFWTSLFALASERGVETYLVNWNIFVSPELAKARGLAAYSADWSYFGEGDTSDLVKQYTRECVTQVIDEYPGLTGLGITHGERMGGMTPRQRQDWLVDTVIAGMKAAKRPAKLIHRAPLSAGTGSGGSTAGQTERMTRAAMEAMDLPAPIWVEMKFNWSHAHSSPHLVQVHGGPLTDAYWNPPPHGYRITWMARNEDILCLRWGEPDFVRRHIALNGGAHVGGYFVGSECYIPAVDYLTQPDHRGDWQYAFQRQWFFYRVWGRLLYAPDTPDAAFAAEFIRRYGEVGARLFRALVLGSRMPLRLASLYRATWDFTLYAEGFLAPASSGGSFDQSSPFLSVNELIDHATLDPDLVSIRDFVAAGDTWRDDQVTPPRLADALERDGLEALALLAGVTSAEPTLGSELADCRAWAHLSLYFAEKVRGGVALQRFRVEHDPAHRADAVAHLTRAVEQWRAVVRETEPWYRVAPLLHLAGHGDGCFHWSRYVGDVLRDVAIAGAG